MKPRLRLHLICASSCALLVSLNWFRSVQYARNSGVTSESLAPIALALLLSAVAATGLAAQCFRLARIRLERGDRISRGAWIQNGWVVGYALPLLWHQQSTSTSLTSDGVAATTIAGYGHTLSIYVFACAIVAMFLYQIRFRLLSVDESSCRAD